MSTPPWPCCASDHLIQIAANSPLKKTLGLTSEPDVASPLPPLPPATVASPLQELVSNADAACSCNSSLHGASGLTAAEEPRNQPRTHDAQQLSAAGGGARGPAQQTSAQAEAQADFRVFLRPFASPPPVRLDVDGEGGFAQLLASADSAVSSAIPPAFALDSQSAEGERGAELGALPSRTSPLGGSPLLELACSCPHPATHASAEALQPPVAAEEPVAGQFVARQAVAGQAAAGQLVTGQLIVGEREALATSVVGGGATGSAEGTWGRAVGAGGNAHCVGANGGGARGSDEGARFWESYVAERAVAAGEMAQRNWGEEGRGWCFLPVSHPSPSQSVLPFTQPPSYSLVHSLRPSPASGDGGAIQGLSRLLLTQLVVMVERYKLSVDCLFAVQSALELTHYHSSLLSPSPSLNPRLVVMVERYKVAVDCFMFHTLRHSHLPSPPHLLNPRLMVMVERYKVSVDCFFAVWFVLGNIWVFGANSAAQTAPLLLSVVFLALSCVSYAMPFLLCATICCCLPCIITLMGFDNHIASISPPQALASEGAAPDEIGPHPQFIHPLSVCFPIPHPCPASCPPPPIPFSPPPLSSLSVVFLTLSCVSYAMPFLLCATICCCLPCIITLMGFDNDIASISPASKGAAPDEIASLPCFKYKELKRRRKGGSGGVGKGSSKGSGEVGLLWAGMDKERVVQGEDAVCCICLGHYKDGAELRQLPCNHHFHQSCVDTWLRINASCPLCKVDISGRPKEAVDPVLANEFAAASFV
ncbi:unnamed protein product [Closterium sp. NIES-65]|nr:unnamed protein product [Closterium sp. NIES-65]